jgi:hypothetical protein
MARWRSLILIFITLLVSLFFDVLCIPKAPSSTDHRRCFADQVTMRLQVSPAAHGAHLCER